MFLFTGMQQSQPGMSMPGQMAGSVQHRPPGMGGMNPMGNMQGMSHLPPQQQQQLDPNTGMFSHWQN